MSLMTEVYADYKNEIRSYTQDIVPTPFMFMRDYSIAMSEFQKETKYIEASLKIEPVNNKFYVPADYYYMTQVLSPCGNILEERSAKQFDYRFNKNIYYSAHMGIEPYSGRGFYTIYNGEIVVDKDYEALYIRYIPHLHPISESSEQWFNTKGDTLSAGDVAVANVLYRVMHGNIATGTAPTVALDIGAAFIGDGLATIEMVDNPTYASTFRAVDTEKSWYPYDLYFDKRFNTVKTYVEIAAYEPAFLAHCICKFLRTKGSPNHTIYLYEWQRYLKQAKTNMPKTFGRLSPRYYSLQPVSNYGVRTY